MGDSPFPATPPKKFFLGGETKDKTVNLGEEGGTGYPGTTAPPTLEPRSLSHPRPLMTLPSVPAPSGETRGCGRGAAQTGSEARGPENPRAVTGPGHDADPGPQTPAAMVGRPSRHRGWDQPAPHPLPRTRPRTLTISRFPGSPRVLPQPAPIAAGQRL